MPLSQALVGIQSVSDGATVTSRAGRSGDVIISMLHGRHYESSSRKNMFLASNQTAQALSAALTTTYTGLCLSNPAGSGVHLSLIQVGFAAQVAPASIATVGLIGGFISTGLVTHTAVIPPSCSFLGSTTPQGRADSQATLPTTPVWLKHLGTVFTTLTSTAPILVDLGGLIVIPPGGYVAVGGLVALTALCSFGWEEVPA